MNKIDQEYFNAIKNNDIQKADKIIRKCASNNGYTIKAYHGTNTDFNIFKSFIGSSIWFSEDRDKIEKGNSGASGFKKIISVFLNVTKTAGWEEYEKLGTGQIIQQGFDSIKLDDDWVIFSPNQIKLADTIIKNNSGNMIQPSKRFNMNKKDIREYKILTFKNFLLEYLTEPMSYLKKYLNMSDKDKYSELAYNFSQYIEEFVFNSDVNNRNKLLDELEKQLDGAKYFEIQEIGEAFLISHQDLMNEYGKYVYENIQDKDDVSAEELPSWVYLDNPTLIKKQWLIHFSDSASDIAKEGFKYGADSVDKLGLTTWLSSFDKANGGYNFAYTLNDFEKYGNNSNNDYKYGKEAVLFISSGIKTYHWGDAEPQVIFWGKLAQDIVLLENNEDNWFITNTKNGNVIYQNKKLSEVVKWVETNYRQYRNVLS